MPVYDEMIDSLEECLEDCCKDKIKATDIEIINEIVDAIYKLHKINMLEDVEVGEYNGEYRGEYGNEYRRYGESHDRGTYGARRGKSRDSRGRYRNRYGHDKETMIAGLEEKMKDLSGEDQDVLRRAINIVERR